MKFRLAITCLIALHTSTVHADFNTPLTGPGSEGWSDETVAPTSGAVTYSSVNALGETILITFSVNPAGIVMDATRVRIDHNSGEYLADGSDYESIGMPLGDAAKDLLLRTPFDMPGGASCWSFNCNGSGVDSVHGIIRFLAL